jgi:hypothetical protein
MKPFTVDTEKLTITLNETITARTLYSTLKDAWRDDVNLIRFPFPMIFVGIYNGVTEIQCEGWALTPESVPLLVPDPVCMHCGGAMPAGATVRIEQIPKPPTHLPGPPHPPDLWRRNSIIYLYAIRFWRHPLLLLALPSYGASLLAMYRGRVSISILLALLAVAMAHLHTKDLET